jgi:microcompartment protein CcmK/EutM
MENLIVVKCSQSALSSQTDSFFFSLAPGSSAHTGTAVGGANSPLDFLLVAIVDEQVN